MLDQVEKVLTAAEPRPGSMASVTIDVNEFIQGGPIAGFSHLHPVEQLIQWSKWRGYDIIISPDARRAEIIRKG